ncbi:hypothetical protein BR93DRAFT_522064 [Coniochaeta sp. PMI_546]|nr:hypothetical protein BR93DRAFT_522064 [Coniochaeta sp. PMI_546]
MQVENLRHPNQRRSKSRSPYISPPSSDSGPKYPGFPPGADAGYKKKKGFAVKEANSSNLLISAVAMHRS